MLISYHLITSRQAYCALVHIRKPGSSRHAETMLLVKTPRRSRKEGGAARRRLLSGCRQQPTGDWTCVLFPTPQPTDCCVKWAAAAHYCGSQPLSQVRNLASLRAGRPAQGCSMHTQGGRHQGTWLKSHIDPGCRVPRLVWCILRRVGAPGPFHRLRQHCEHFAGWIQRACTGQQAPVDPRDTSLGP